MHHDILTLFDAYLTEQQDLRRRLDAARPVLPGERREAAIESVRAAERYAAAMNELLGLAPV